MPTTMMRQVCRRARVEAYLTEDQFTAGSEHPKRLANILDPQPGHYSKAAECLNSAETSAIVASGKDLSDVHYNLILQYLRSSGQPWRHFEHIPHPPGSLVLPPRARQPYEFTLNSYSFSCHSSHPGNSGIQFKRPSDSIIFTGFIQAIWQIPLQGHIQTFFAVEIHKSLPASARIPFTSLPNFNTTIVDAQPSSIVYIIEPRHILTHLTMYKRLRGTYGLDRDVWTICWSLNRGRRS